MIALICVLLSAVALALSGFATPLLNGMSDIVFDVASQIPSSNWQGIIYSLSDTVYTIGVYLMIIKCLVKIFNTYVLWNDGEEAEPIQILMNFVKAIIVAASFPYIYRYFTDIAKKATEQLNANIAWYTGDDLSDLFGSLGASLGIATLVLAIVFFVGIIVTCFSFMKRGIELELMLIGVPLACIGLLDNDKGIFKSYMNQMAKIIITTIFQLTVTRLGLAIGLSASFLPGDAVSSSNMIWGIACMLLGLKIPQILSEWMVPAGGGGGMSGKLNSIAMVGKAVKGMIK